MRLSWHLTSQTNRKRHPFKKRENVKIIRYKKNLLMSNDLEKAKSRRYYSILQSYVRMIEIVFSRFLHLNDIVTDSPFCIPLND